MEGCKQNLFQILLFDSNINYISLFKKYCFLFVDQYRGGNQEFQDFQVNHILFFFNCFFFLSSSGEIHQTFLTNLFLKKNWQLTDDIFITLANLSTEPLRNNQAFNIFLCLTF